MMELIYCTNQVLGIYVHPKIGRYCGTFCFQLRLFFVFLAKSWPLFDESSVMVG